MIRNSAKPKEKHKFSNIKLKKTDNLKKQFLFILVLIFCMSTANAISCSSGLYSSGSHCTPCQVGNYCTGSNSYGCSTNYYTSTRASGCTYFTNGWLVAGILYNCPTNKYSSSGSCQTCPGGYNCDGSTSYSYCGSTVPTYNGDCFNCPSGYTCSNNLDSCSPASAGNYVSSNTQYGCNAQYYCINGVQTNCPSGMWTGGSYTTCNYCPHGHVCNWNPTTCDNGYYITSLTSQSCATCNGGYICKKDWFGQIKVYPGTYAPSGYYYWTECPERNYCSTSGYSGCSMYTYSGRGDMACDSLPNYLYVYNGYRDPLNVETFSRGYRQHTSYDYSYYDCGSSYYCPGLDGGYYGFSGEGITISTGSINSKSPGYSCSSTSTYSNGGSECWACTGANSDRSQCYSMTNGGITTQFAKSFYNQYSEREGRTQACLDSAQPKTGYSSETSSPKSGYYGETCNIEGSLTSSVIFNPTECDGVRSTSDNVSKVGGLKNKHTISHYGQCSWCPDNLNCIYHNAFFPFFFGYLLQCPNGEYSANGDLDCHRNNVDSFCKTGYYRTVHSSDKDDQWIHDQDKRYECKPVNTSPSTNYVALDSTKSPSCSYGDWVRYGIEGCVTNSPGFYNDENIVVVSSTKCASGFICKPDVIKNKLRISQLSCPKGSVGMTDGARSEQTQCDYCRAGKYCPEGTSISAQVDCAQGYYCPAGTSGKIQFSCGAGFYGSSAAGRSFSETCTMCQGAKYCEQSATSGTTCPNGYYCFPYTDDKNKYPAMPGKYIGTATGTVSGAAACPQGKYCPLGSSAPIDCPVGTYTASTGMGELINCGQCPAGSACPTAGTSSGIVACSVGHYCPMGTQNPYDKPCPPGTYSDNTNNKAVVDCTDCALGKACLQRSSTTATSITTTSGTIMTNAVQNCAAGYYCPLRTEYPTQYPCPAGTYTTATNLGAASSCTQCPGGKYCAAGSATATADCPKNFYCPAGATSPLPCAAGKYSAAGASTCVDCTTGHICPQYHENDNPIVCPAGYYKDSTGSAGPCDLAPEGYYSTGTGAKISCGDGKWAPPGGKDISVCTSCPVGYYCVSGVKTACGSGKWCASGSTAASDCTAGYYCPDTATTYLRVCPAGTYSAAGQASCTNSPGGYYTPQQTTDANKQATKCSRGFYCPGGSTGPTDKTCDNGKYTLSTTTASLASDCSTCTAGYYCLRGVVDPIICPAGYYCIPTEPYPIPCDKGTFRATTGAASISDCTPCTAGKVCSQTAMTAPDKDCDAGFYCPAGSVFPRTTEPSCSTTGCDLTSSKVQPTGKTRAIECPAGYYCPAASATPTACAAGKYNAVSGQRVSSACLDCPAGKYCAGTGNTGITGTCQSGYYCAAGSSSATQTPAPLGYYSTAGAASATKCSPGYYQDTTGQSSCKPCTAGNYCPGFGSQSMTICPAGSYCPALSNKPTPCPQGTFSASTGLSAITDCTACTAGKYCSGTGLTAVTGNCMAGYYCKSYSFSQMPYTDSSTAVEADQRYGPCTSGNYCPTTTGTPIPCPAGTYNEALMGAALSDCKACLPGKYCSGTGNKAPTGDCQAGYYCPGGTSAATPATACVAGEYCPTGSSKNTKCPAGYFTSSAQASACTDCPAGKYCVAGTSTPADCPAGSYCPLNTKYANQYPCPAGTFNSVTLKTQLSDCVACPIGNVCEFSGTSNSAATVCAAGYFCLAGSKFTIPESSTYGGMCQPGQFCPAGSGAAQPCTGGSYCSKYLLGAVSGTCDIGYYCTAIGAKSKVIPDDYASNRGAICPIGKYCPAGTTTPIDCPVGTYSASTGLGASTDCYQCPAGFYCDTTGISDYSSKICPAGYYCPKGTSSSTSNQCPTGYYCPAGSTNKIQCDGGTYQDTVGQSSCKICTKGNYCPFTPGTGLSAQVTCPKGYKCSDTGMIGPVVCEKGWYQDQTGQQACVACPAGSYCDRQGLQAVSGSCPAGFYCLINQKNYFSNMCKTGYSCPLGSSSTTSCAKGKYCDRSMLGTSGTNCLGGYYCDEFQITAPNPSGKTCPRGYYCQAGSINPTPCAIGTYNNKLGSLSSADCLSCPYGKLCDESALVEPKSTCPATKYCTNGSTQNNCDKGYYCPAGYDYEIKCQPGTYQDLTTQSTCKDCPEGYYCDGDLSSNNYLPLKCPPGYYCPAKTIHYHLFPCPAGRLGLSVSTAYGLKMIGDCTSCTVNKYCDRRGLGTPTGDCQAGYLCSAGSILPTGPNAKKCDPGYYCSAGIQTACSLGTYNYEYAATSSNDCIPCEHGKYCPNTISSKVDCPAGKTCAEGIYSSSQAVTCPSGKYCPTGSFQPISCEPGTYQNLSGQTSCKSCSANYICNGFALTSQTSCPSYRTCPQNSIRGRRCNPGQYIPAASNTCSACLTGKYCWPIPKASPDNGEQGTCSSGYVCRGSSAYQKPLTLLSAIVPGSSEFSTYTGQAYPGYYSTNGYTLTACSTGTFQPSPFSTSCITCREGYYCPITGLSSLINYPCAGGYTCTTGLTTGTPSGNKCPINTYCEGGNVTPQRCPDGAKNPSSTGLSSCIDCGAGRFCYQSGSPGSFTENVVSCSTGNTQCAAENLKRGLKCQDGYELNGSNTCVLCTATYYCRGGYKAGFCVAGYICNQDVASPISVPNPINRQCPVGGYCKEGATDKINCGLGTFNGNLGGVSNQLCFPCEPGYVCKPDATGVVQVTSCPMGSYCPEYDKATNTQSDPIPCPKFTSSSVQKLFLIEMCSFCPSSYNCDSTGITEYTLHPCPIGYYCIPNALNDLTNNAYQSLMKCPLGTYGVKTKLADKSGCAACPAGNYCDPSISSITPTVCTGGNYCPEGSDIQITCTGGKYCNSGNNFQLSTCPVNYSCASGIENPSRCPAGVICPVGSVIGTKCNKGFEVQQISGVDTCIACLKGYYNTDASTSCKKCPAGYLCYGEPSGVTANSAGGTNSATPTIKNKHYGEICPVGYYCPEGSYSPTACPAGTYNRFTGMKSLSDCISCSVNTYNDKTAQTGCQPCGEYAYSSAGAQTCTCYGANRSFGKTDSSCRCQPRFVYRKSDKTIERYNVSKEDCVPLTYSRCDSSNEGRKSDGSCATLSSSTCSSQCSSGGTFDAQTGLCTCKDTPTTADEICNSNCRSSASSVKLSSTGTMTYTTSSGTSSTVDISSDSNCIGSLTCSNENGCKINQSSNSNGVFKGKYGTNDYIKNKVRRMLGDIVDQTEKQSNKVGEMKRFMSTVSADTATISNPVICIENGDSLQFEITNYSNYPVYDENNLLNSNANFDYGPFIDLASQIKAKSLAGMTGSTNPILFSYTFTTGGTYVFTDYTITTNTMVVVVASTGGTCPSSTANVQTSTSTSVSSTGSTQTTDIVQNMDYYMLSILLVLLIAIICFVGLSVAYCLHNAFNIKVPKSDGYRNYQKTHDLQFEILGDEDAPEVLNHHICKGFLVSDEHDMENVSYNIHAEIIQHSQEFLDLYDSAMNITEETKMNNKRITNELIYELDAMIKLIGDSAITGKMYYGPAKDLEDVMRDMQKDQHLLDKSDQRPITPNEIDSLKSVLKKEILEKEDQLRVLIMKDDTKSKEETIKQEIMKEMNIQSINDSEDQIFNIKNKSFQTKFKEKIEEDDNFSSLEKDKMIFDYERKLENIEVELEKERNRQDHSLSQLLKIRNEERRKKQTLKGIEDKKNKELDKVQKQFEEKLKDEYDNIDKLISEAEIQLTWSNSKTDKDGYKQEINRLRDKKKDIGKQIEQNRLKAAKDAISRLDKEGEMTESSIKSLIDQFIPKEKLDEINQEFKDQKDKLDKEKEYKIEELRRKQEEDIEFEQELGGYGDNVADQIVNLFSQRFLEELHEATNEEKDVHFERMNRLKELLRNIDIQSEKESLLNACNNMDNSLEEDVRRDQERNNESLSHKIEERRKFNRIKKMEALRIIHEEEEAKLMINLGVCCGCKI